MTAHLQQRTYQPFPPSKPTTFFPSRITPSTIWHQPHHLRNPIDPAKQQPLQLRLSPVSRAGRDLSAPIVYAAKFKKGKFRKFQAENASSAMTGPSSSDAVEDEDEDDEDEEEYVPKVVQRGQKIVYKLEDIFGWESCVEYITKDVGPLAWLVGWRDGTCAEQGYTEEDAFGFRQDNGFNDLIEVEYFVKPGTNTTTWVGGPQMSDSLMPFKLPWDYIDWQKLGLSSIFPHVSSSPVVAFIGVFVGSWATFAVVHSRRRILADCEEQLLTD